MKLDKHVIDMFTELTKPANDVKMEKTCYGTISIVDGTRYVKLDGSDLLVPAASTVKTSHGDRVTVLMKNHSLTITGNLTAPATDGEGGSSGEAGTAATIKVGTVTTGEAGSSAAVTNVGTTSAAVFDFVIPKGDKGEKGDTGTWDGTIPDHEHTVSDITDFPVSELERVSTAIVAGERTGLQWTAMQARNGDTLFRLQLDTDYDRALLFKSTDGGTTWNELPLGNADTVDGKHASDFASVRKITTQAEVDGFLESGIYSVEGVEMVFGSISSTFYMLIVNRYRTDLNYNSELAIPYDGGLQRGVYYRNCANGKWGTWTNVADGGNADIAQYIGTWGGSEEYYGEQLKMRALFNKFGDSRFGLTTDTDNEIRVDYATNADIAQYIGTWGTPEQYYGEALKMRALYNKFGDSRFGLTTDTDNEIRVDYATNAGTVGGKSPDAFFSRYQALLTVDYVSKADMDTDYKGVVDSNTANSIGLDGSGNCWWHIIGLRNSNDDGYGTQLAIPLYPGNSNQRPKYRTSAGTTFWNWKNLSDGGNAASVGAYTEAKLTELEARIAALEGGTTR